jgi:O-antigen/teichoic acid export membrane protein
MLAALIDRVRSPARRATLGAVGAGVFLQGFLVLSGILTARMLAPTDRGHLALLVVIPSTIAQLGSLGLSLSVSYHVARRPDHARPILARIRRPVLIQAVALTAIHAGVVLSLIPGKSDEFVATAIISLGTIPTTLLLEYALAVLQGLQRYTLFNSLRVLPNLVYAALLLALLVTSSGTLVTILTGSILAVGVFGAITTLYALRELEPPASDQDVPTRRDLVRFALQSYLGFISPVESLRLDQLYIGAALPAAALGLYVVGISFTNFARFIAQSIGLVAAPHVASLHDPRDQLRATWRFFWLTVAVCGAATLLLIAGMPWLLPFLFGNEYSGAVGIARILVLGAFFLAIRRVLADAARGYGLPTVASLAEILTFVWFVPAVLILSAALEAKGVAIAWSSAVAFGFVVLLARFRAARSAVAPATGGVP